MHETPHTPNIRKLNEGSACREIPALRISGPSSATELQMFFESWGFTYREHDSVCQAIAQRMFDDAEDAYGPNFAKFAEDVVKATEDAYYLRGNATWDELFESWQRRQLMHRAAQ